jgi:hypothetical protein
MLIAESGTLATRALGEIDRLLNESDPGGTIDSVSPILHRCRRTLLRLQATLCRSAGAIRPNEEADYWRDDIIAAYRQLGGAVSHSRLYREVQRIRRASGRSWPAHAEELIRQMLQAHCADAPQYRGGPDLFRKVQRGVWALKDRDCS